jgi:hypothetical protein
MRSSVRTSFQRVLRLGLLTKIVVGATVAFAGAGAVAATSALPETADDTVAVAPAADEAAADTGAPAADELNEREGLAHEGAGDAEDAEDTDDAPNGDEPADSGDQPRDAVAARQDETPAVVEVDEPDDGADDTDAGQAQAQSAPSQDTAGQTTAGGAADDTGTADAAGVDAQDDTEDVEQTVTTDEPDDDTADEPDDETSDGEDD